MSRQGGGATSREGGYRGVGAAAIEKKEGSKVGGLCEENKRGADKTGGRSV